MEAWHPEQSSLLVALETRKPGIIMSSWSRVTRKGNSTESTAIKLIHSLQVLVCRIRPKSISVVLNSVE